MALGLLDLIWVSLIAGSIAAVGVGLNAYLQRGKAHSRDNNKPDDITFLLDGEEIADTTCEAALLLARAGFTKPNRESLIATLEPTFENLRSALENLNTDPVILTATSDSAAWLNITPVGQMVRVTVADQTAANAAQIDALTETRENAELNDLRAVVQNAPTMMWRCDEKGQLIWANDAYLTASDAISSSDLETPSMSDRPLFVELDEPQDQGTTPRRCALNSDNPDDIHWYDVTTFQSDTSAFYYATDADSIVRAELAQRKVVQTISQTFAQLSIGLAIFDKRRQLVTFNPALFDMTGLNFEFLSGRPSLDSMLDRLRETRMLPEPKNYTSWRDQFRAMEQAAKDGTYLENWDLPDGQTFRVTGRPHPDGAFALLFEDISAEISLTRRFRTEIETSQAVLDHIEDAVVVFSNGGNLVMANAAYTDLWGTDLTDGLMQYDLRVELRKWQDRCTPARIWTNLREFSTQMGLRKPWTDHAIMDDGRHITCQANPISGGMTLVRFKFERQMKPTIQKLTQTDHALFATKG